MKMEKGASYSVLCVLLAVLLFVSTQAQIASPSFASGGRGVTESLVTADGKTEDAAEKQIASSVSHVKNEKKYDIPEEMPETDGGELAVEEILPSAEGAVIEVPGQSAEEAAVMAADTQVIVPVTPNNIIRDSLPSIITTKVYTFTLAERGMLVFAFNHTGLESSACQWLITLYEEYSPDGSLGNIAYRELDCLSYTQTGSAVQSSYVGVLPGNYRVTVACVTGYTNRSYDLTIGYAPTESCEIEYNNSRARYTELPLDKTLNGGASSYSNGDSDVDWYMFEITDTGYSVFYFDCGADTSQNAQSIAWRISIIDMEGREYFSTNVTMNGAMLNSGLMGLTPNIYFVKIESRVHSRSPYKVSVSFTPDSSIERELNESRETATPLALNTEMIGSLTERDAQSDRDYYTFTMGIDGFVSLSFSHEALSEQHRGWNITVTDENGFTVYKTVSDWTQSELKSPAIGLPAGKYYVLIDSDGIYRSSIVYRLRIDAEESDSWETEPNNSIATADVLPFGKSVSGTLIEIGVDYDKDYFMLTADSACRLEVSFSHIKTNESKEGWVVSLLDADGNVIAEKSSNWNSDAVTFTADVQPGTYYVLIESGLYFSSNRYTLTVRAR